MSLNLSPEELSALVRALRRDEALSRRDRFVRHVDRVAESGWASIADLEDVVATANLSLDQLRFDISLERWCELFGLTLRNVYPQPGRRQGSVLGGRALATADVAYLLIQFERMGFAVDPEPIVSRVRPAIEALPKLTEAELSVLWFDRQRHKASPLAAQSTERSFSGDVQEFVTSSGYRVRSHMSDGERPWLVTIRAPRYRRPRAEVRTTCPQCGWEWTRGDSDSSATHRREHRRRMAYLNPQPSARMRGYRNDTQFGATDVSAVSPAWMHAEMYQRATAFRREFGFDFVQWESPGDDRDPDATGVLIVDEVARIIGACAFRHRQHEGRSFQAMQWIWVAPPYRRRGVVTGIWPRLRSRFDAFFVEGPVSQAMQAFLRKVGDERLTVWPPSDSN